MSEPIKDEPVKDEMAICRFHSGCPETHYIGTIQYHCEEAHWTSTRGEKMSHMAACGIPGTAADVRAAFERGDQSYAPVRSAYWITFYR